MKITVIAKSKNNIFGTDQNGSLYNFASTFVKQNVELNKTYEVQGTDKAFNLFRLDSITR